MTRSICSCCQFLRKDKPIPNSQDLEAGVRSDITNTIPIMLDTKNLEEFKIKNNNIKDNLVIINETTKYNNEVFHTARTAREDIVKDYKTMEQLVREIRLDHGIVDTPRLPTIDVTPIESSKIDIVEKISSTSVSNINQEFNKINSTLHYPSLIFYTGMESGISTPDISQMSPARQESGYESCTFEDISLDEVKIIDKKSNKDEVLRKNMSFYGHMSTIPQNIYLLISYIYILLVSTVFRVIKKISG